MSFVIELVFFIYIIFGRHHLSPLFFVVDELGFDDDFLFGATPILFFNGTSFHDNFWFRFVLLFFGLLFLFFEESPSTTGSSA